jgi:hypothetical protein
MKRPFLKVPLKKEHAMRVVPGGRFWKKKRLMTAGELFEHSGEKRNEVGPALYSIHPE